MVWINTSCGLALMNENTNREQKNCSVPKQKNAAVRFYCVYYNATWIKPFGKLLCFRFHAKSINTTSSTSRSSGSRIRRHSRLPKEFNPQWHMGLTLRLQRRDRMGLSPISLFTDKVGTCTDIRIVKYSNAVRQ